MISTWVVLLVFYICIKARFILKSIAEQHDHIICMFQILLHYLKNAISGINVISKLLFLSLGEISAGGLFVLGGIIHPVVSTLAQTWFIIYYV